MTKLVLVFVFLAATASALTIQKKGKGPLDDQVDSFGNSKLTPACADIKCGEMECVAPFTLKADGSCCGTCFAPDHVVALDRHFAIDSPYKMDTQCDGAPSFCKGPGPAAVCFQPSCAAGFKAHCAPGECCPKCVPESA